LRSLRPPPPPRVSTLSLHDALPISARRAASATSRASAASSAFASGTVTAPPTSTRRFAASRKFQTCGPKQHGTPYPAGSIMLCRSEEHTSELQSLRHLVCRLLLEKK